MNSDLRLWNNYSKLKIAAADEKIEKDKQRFYMMGPKIDDKQVEKSQ
jgi:hypothetical protein